MKKIILQVLILLNCSLAFGQKAESSANKLAVQKNVDGVLMSSAKTITENLSSSPELSIFTNAITVAGLVDTLNNRGPVTVFAPDNKAFEKLSPGLIDTLLLPSHKTALINLLTSHMVSGMLTSKDILRQIKAGNGQAVLITLSGAKLIASINENRNILLTDDNGNQSVVRLFDIQQSNGILCVITRVLTPQFTQELQNTSKP
jgi:uncharacterized surface protein with fasciclin (FAS1) repeats